MSSLKSDSDLSVWVIFDQVVLHVQQDLFVGEGVVLLHDGIRLGLRLDDCLHGGRSSLCFVHCLVTRSVSGFQGCIDSQLGNEDIGIKFDLLSISFFIRLDDILAFYFRVLDLLFILVRQRQGSQLEEPNFVPGLCQYLFLQIIGHLFLDIGSPGEEIVRCVLS